MLTLVFLFLILKEIFMDQVSYVNIRTFFDRTLKNKDVSSLSAVYSDKDRLNNAIKDIVLSSIDDNDITDKKVLLKPNLVLHNSNPNDEICLRTNWSVILGLLRVILEKKPKAVVIGDAPIQRCKWNLMMNPNFVKEVEDLSRDYNVPILIEDFRAVKFDRERNVLEYSKNGEYIIFDVAKKSWLEDITTDKPLFRVTCYNPDELAKTHKKGVHKYCVTSQIFKCDTIITIPKVKTHQKSGITNSLKILVGINGNKDYLPHHRIGALGYGGDCYKGWHILRRLSELLLDSANRRIGRYSYKIIQKLSSLLWKLSFPNKAQNLAAGWYGNDTVWRMVLDLNLIAIYGKSDGTLADVPQRTLYTLCDGIIGGQGNGPLSPEPVASGFIAFSNNSYAMDVVAGKLFKLNIDRIPLLKVANKLIQDIDLKLVIDGKESTIRDLEDISTSVLMPPGWVDYDK